MHLLHVFFTYSHHVPKLNIFCFTNFLHLSLWLVDFSFSLSLSLYAYVLLHLSTIVTTATHCSLIHLFVCTHFSVCFFFCSLSLSADNKPCMVCCSLRCFRSRGTDSLQMVTMINSLRLRFVTRVNRSPYFQCPHFQSPEHQEKIIQALRNRVSFAHIRSL